LEPSLLPDFTKEIKIDASRSPEEIFKIIRFMKKSKHIKNIGILPERLAGLRRATLIASAGASTRLEGSRLSDKKVQQIANIVFGQK